MVQIVIRNVDDDVIRRLKRRATEEKLSLSALVRRIITDAAKPKPRQWSKKRLVAEMDRIAALTPQNTKRPLGWQLIREDRDKR
jgi:plasmid stability protein